MPKYLFRINYDKTGAQAIIDDGGSSRVRMADQLAGSLGGEVEAFYFAFGGDDAFAIVDLPSAEAAAAVSLTVGSGNVSIETVALLTAEQMDEAAKLSPSYAPPGE